MTNCRDEDLLEKMPTPNTDDKLKEDLISIVSNNNAAKLIKGSDNCTVGPRGGRNCNKCPYSNEYFCITHLLKDMTALVKQMCIRIGAEEVLHESTEEKKND